MVSRKDLAEVVANKFGLSMRKSALVVGSIIDTISEAARAGELVELRGFGTFRVRKYGARKCNLGDGGTVPPRESLVFKASSAQKVRK